MKVYIAGSSQGEEAERVAWATRLLADRGIEATNTWAQTIAKVGDANPRNAGVDHRFEWAAQCLKEIDAADAVWFLVPSLPTMTRGAWTEIGYAFAMHKEIVCSGDTAQSIFCALGDEYEDDELALDWLERLAQRSVRDPGINLLCKQCGAVRAGLDELAEVAK